jgi:branched-subunit amino acid aminotransferase/4-amino-4-deoxychorismate lyase
MSIALLNGQPATLEDLRALALVNYGHFTVLVVRGRRVAGLDFHLARLQSATRELFATELEPLRLVEDLRAAMAAAPGDDAVLRVTVFARAFDYRQPMQAVVPDVLVSRSPLSVVAKPALRLKSYRFERALPHLKHVGTFPLFHYRRQAMRQGFDDALFVGADGRISEGSIWNIGFWDGSQVIWPQAPALRGSCEHLLRTALAAEGLPQQARPVSLADAAGFTAAFAANATGLQPVTALDGAVYAPDQGLMTRLQRLLRDAPGQPLD